MVRPPSTPRKPAPAPATGRPRGTGRGLGSAPAEVVEAWDVPPIRAVQEPVELLAFTQELASTRPSALGVAVLLDADPRTPSDRRDDPRYVGLDRLAIAVPDQGVTLFDARALAPASEGDDAGDDPLSVLQQVLDGPPGGRPPYVVMHDAHRTLAALARRGLRPPRFGCTRIVANLLAEGTGRRGDVHLDELMRSRLGLETPRALPGRYEYGLISLELGTDIPAVLACAADVLIPLMRGLTPRLRELRLSRAHELECQVLPAVIDMEAAGVRVDQAGFQRIANGWARERREKLEQVPEGEQREAPEFKSRMARLEKLISGFGHWARDHVDLDGRIRCHLDPIATDTGRFACSQPNLQQVPAEHTAPGLRGCFVPEPGYRFVIADYAQIELRVAAHIARCPVLSRVFREGRDPHRATAATLARKPESAITSHERKLAKAVNFGFLFGMGARRFQSYARSSYGLDLSLPQAERARDAFFATYPGLRHWHRHVGNLSRRAEREDVTVRTAIGRRKRFPAQNFSFNAALNIPVQGTAADGFKLAMIDLRALLEELGGRGVLCVHDEYIAEVPEDRADEACARIRETMERAMARVVPSVPIVAEAHVARSWGDEPD